MERFYENDRLESAMHEGTFTLPTDTLKLHLDQLVGDFPEAVAIIEQPHGAILYANQRMSTFLQRCAPRFSSQRLACEVPEGKETNLQFLSMLGEPLEVVVRTTPVEWNGRKALVLNLRDASSAAPDRPLTGYVRGSTAGKLTSALNRMTRRPAPRPLRPLSGRRLRRLSGEFRRALQQRGSEQHFDEQRLRRLAFYDVLTGIPNRQLFHDRFNQLLRQAGRNRTVCALLFIDLDHFKHVNDTLGHEAGDALLREVALRLTAAVRRSDIVARLGGDEFTIVLTEIGRAEDAALVANKILESLSRPIVLSEGSCVIGASIGVAIFPGDGNDAAALIRAADQAMYQAKHTGRSAFVFADQALDLRASERLSLRQQLLAAIDNQELELHYQPVVDLKSGGISGFEALLRWQHPQRGLLLPGEFLPLAVASGTSCRLEEFVIREACRQTSEWRQQGFHVLPVSVNLSCVRMDRFDVAGVVGKALAEFSLEPRLLEVELGEQRCFVEETASRRVQELKSMDVTLALDDFRQNTTPLGQLVQLPFDKIKVDRSFVADLPGSNNDQVLLRSVVDAAQQLSCKVVAGGVETAEQLRLVEEQGCDEVQGNFVHAVLPAARIPALLATASRC
ncbi:MAG: hypothetical protein A2284_05245 [Deltaproteobacteria bacterium RIFOXYA12_FULL_61_11]|nr:MAG: hypothetical protein A2284_05245 [Deltaproteobacteria bacterium RIFOXYA12_FULL_61_11]